MTKIYVLDKRDYTVHYVGTCPTEKTGSVMSNGVFDFVRENKLDECMLETLTENQLDTLKKSLGAIK